MDSAFQLAAPEEIQPFFESFPQAARRKGEALARRGHVQELSAVKPGTHYAAVVRDGGDYKVELFYDNFDGWIGDCSCAIEVDCPHVYATMCALMAEQGAATVRNLSAGVSVSGALGQVPKPKPASSLAGDVGANLEAANGRPLDKSERAFINKLQQVYQRFLRSREVTYWDFQELGLPLPDGNWGKIQLWPSPPHHEHEFWLYLAASLEERRLPIPVFMQPITDLSLIEAPLRQWRRTRDIERWKQTLGNLQSQTARSGVPVGETDLRLVIGPEEASLAWQRPGQPVFELLKVSQLRQLHSEYEQELVRFTPEAELLWGLFGQDFAYYTKPTLAYGDFDEPQSILGRLLRIRSLESRVVSGNGSPLARAAVPLRWELRPPLNADEDYSLKLVQGDGSAVPPLLSVLPGQPTLYLTATAVYPGPESPMGVLDPMQENRIPAPALERASGVSFLQALGVELPPTLRARVQLLTYRLTITCSLQPAYLGSDLEECSVAVSAEASDGKKIIWKGYNWTKSGSAKATKRGESAGQIVVYDESSLAQVPELLRPLNLKHSPYRGSQSVRLTRKFPELFSQWLKSIPSHVNVELEGELASFANGDIAGRLSLEATEAGIDWFDLRVVLDVADATLTKEEIKLLLNAKGGYVRLEGRGWRRLQYDLKEDENDKLARLGISPREMSAEPQRFHALQLADPAASKFLPEQQVETIQRRAGEIKARVAPELPKAITADLRPYQLEGFHFLAYLATNSFGGILADDMGLGKTLQALAWLLWLREGAALDRTGGATSLVGQETQPANRLPSLVVCPKSVTDNWQAEAARFAPGFRVRVWPAAELEGFRGGLDSADLHVINYSQLRLLGESLVHLRWLAVILDEGQYIKNPSSQTAQIARALRAQHRLVLSGTPIENRLLDLWSLMAFAMPGVMGSRAQFGKLYDAKGDPFARRRLAARVRPFVLRRTKSQVAKDLPDRIEEDLFCEIEGEQKTLYRAELKRAQQMLLRIQTQKELAQQQFHFLTSLLRLRQICCHPRLVHPDSKATSAKTESFLEQLEPLMEEGQKVLVFSQFVEMLDLLRAPIEERNWPVFYLAGQTENRGDLVRRFQSAEGAAVFLISLKAGGFGLNLTAASYVVLFDPWWNPAVENQAIDRTHRIGQTNKVIAYRLLIKDSIEEKIRALQKQKKALAEDVLGEEKFAQSLTLDDLKFLFAD